MEVAGQGPDTGRNELVQGTAERRVSTGGTGQGVGTRAQEGDYLPTVCMQGLRIGRIRNLPMEKVMTIRDYPHKWATSPWSS